MMPSLFISHGSPTLAIESNEYTAFLSELGRKYSPRAVIIFSAHWESGITTISSIDDTYDMIYDFGGFSRELYEVNYPAKGSSKIASRIKEMLEAQGMPARLDSKRGLDHGSWVVLKLMYPQANIPVIQVSINPQLSPEKQYEIGKAIGELRQEDILIISSGGTVHNLMTIDWNAHEAERWSVEFDDWLIDKLEKKDFKSLFSYLELAPNARRAVPREEHILPLFITLGAGYSEKAPKLLHRSYNYGTLSHIYFEF